MTATKYALVPVVATEEMIAAIRDRGTQDGDCVEHTTAHMMWADALHAAPPFVVTDGDVRRAYVAYHAAFENYCAGQSFVGDSERTFSDKLLAAEHVALRAAIEAVLGGGK